MEVTFSPNIIGGLKKPFLMFIVLGFLGGEMYVTAVKNIDNF